MRRMKSRRSNSSSVAMLAAAADEDLHVERLGRLHDLAERGIVDRHVAPAEQRLALAATTFSAMIVEHDLPPFRVARHEQGADRVMAGLGQRDAELRPPSRRRSGAGSAPACRRRRRRAGRRRPRRDARGCSRICKRVLDDLVRLAVLDVGDEADAAGILLVARDRRGPGPAGQPGSKCGLAARVPDDAGSHVAALLHVVESLRAHRRPPWLPPLRQRRLFGAPAVPGAGHLSPGRASRERRRRASPLFRASKPRGAADATGAATSATDGDRQTGTAMLSYSIDAQILATYTSASTCKFMPSPADCCPGELRCT